MTPSPLPHGAIPIAAGETMSPEVQREYRKMQEFVYGCTVAIRVDSQNQTEIDVGSGVVIEIGNRTFVASAGHVLSKNPYVLFGKIQSIELGAKPKQFSQRQFRDPPDDGTPMTHVLDIGFLEVPNDSHPTICFFKSLVDLQPPNETLTMLVGHPIDAPGSLADPKWATQGRYELIRTAHSAIMQEVRNNKFVFAYPKDVLDLDS